MAEEEIMEEEVSIPGLLEKLMSFALDEAKDRLQEEGELVPFTATLVRDQVYFDTITGDAIEEIYEKAEDLVKSMDGMSGYAFCFDGWVEDEDSDAIIAEGGLPGEEDAYAVCVPYVVVDESTLEFSNDIMFLDYTENFAQTLGEPDPWDPEEEEA